MRLRQKGLCLQHSSCKALPSQQGSYIAGTWYLKQPHLEEKVPGPFRAGWLATLAQVIDGFSPTEGCRDQL